MKQMMDIGDEADEFELEMTCHPSSLMEFHPVFMYHLDISGIIGIERLTDIADIYNQNILQIS